MDVSYDNDFRVVEQRVNGADTVAFGYDDDGLLTSAGALTLARQASTGLLAGTTLGGVTTSLGYSPFGELGAHTAVFGGTDTLYRAVYTRDLLGRITRKVETVEGVTDTLDYAYDEVGRLEEVKQNGQVVESYTYDAKGDRLSATYPSGTVAGTYDDQDRLLTYGGASYSYTAAGELAMRVEGADTTRYTYDELGNLVEVVLPESTVIEYVIDGQNRRVGKKVNGALVQAFLYGDQLNPVAELDSTGAVVARFVYGARANVPEYMVKGGVTYRIVADHLGSVRLVVNTNTGHVAQRIDYDAFGRVEQSTSADFQPLGFAGGLTDGHTSTLRFGYRDYDPSVGRWRSPDPLRFAAGPTNLFEYSASDPVNFMDPTGLIPLPECAKETLANMGFDPKVLDKIDLYMQSPVGRLVSMFGMRGITLGHEIHTVDLVDFSDNQDMAFIAHEVGHAWAVEMVGDLFFYGTYLINGGIALLLTRDISRARDYLIHELDAERMQEIAQELLDNGICPNECKQE